MNANILFCHVNCFHSYRWFVRTSPYIIMKSCEVVHLGLLSLQFLFVPKSVTWKSEQLERTAEHETEKVKSETTQCAKTNRNREAKCNECDSLQHGGRLTYRKSCHSSSASILL